MLCGIYILVPCLFLTSSRSSRATGEYTIEKSSCRAENWMDWFLL